MVFCRLEFHWLFADWYSVGIGGKPHDGLRDVMQPTEKRALTKDKMDTVSEIEKGKGHNVLRLTIKATFI